MMNSEGVLRDNVGYSVEFMEYCEWASAWSFICETAVPWKNDVLGAYY
jgi:hypothetical protein